MKTNLNQNEQAYGRGEIIYFQKVSKFENCRDCRTSCERKDRVGPVEEKSVFRSTEEEENVVWLSQDIAAFEVLFFIYRTCVWQTERVWPL